LIRVKTSLDHKRIRRLVWLVLTVFVLLVYSLQSVAGSVHYSMLMRAYGTVSKPPVILESGTAGSSTIYTNRTSAKASVAAPAQTPTYYPNSYNVATGTYLSGGVPGSVETVDTNYFIARSVGSATSTTAYNPFGYSLLGNTTLVSGTTSDLVSNDGFYMQFRSYASVTSGQTLYSHQETTIVAGQTYYRLKLNSAENASGTTLSADAGTTTGRKLMGKFLYQLTGVSSVPTSTWTIYYRAYKGHVNVEAHCDVDILVRMSNGTIRSTVATHVANSGPLTTSYSTVLGTYAWANYAVVDQTDYLEIDYYIEVTAVKAGYFVYLRIDDNSAGQTRATNIYLPSEYTSEVEFTGPSNTETWNQLVWTIDSSWTTASVTVTVQLYNYTGGGYPSSGNGYYSYTSSATANTDETKNQTININPTHFRNDTGYWKMKVKGVKATQTQFNFKADWIQFKPTYYNEYTVSTEFLFSSMTKNTPTQLNFTVVSEYDIANVSVTIQVWNYSLPSPGYVTSGQGYLTYTSTGTNVTKVLSINTSPQFYTSSGNAKIKVTGVKSTTTQFQQRVNQINLTYKYNSSSTYDYVLKVVNNVTDSWQVNLKVYGSATISRLSSLNISFHDGNSSNQIAVSGGSIVKSEGEPYNLPGGLGSTVYISISNLQATTADTSYLYVYLKIMAPNTSTYTLYVITFEIT